MSKLLIVDNNSAASDKIEEALIETFNWKGDIIKLSRVGDVKEICSRAGFFDDIALALVDLDFRGVDPNDGLNDMDGRDRVLPLIRAAAPWVPVILMSQFFAGENLRNLWEVGSSGFDGIIVPTFFYHPANNVQQWKRMISNAQALRRSNLVCIPVNDYNDRVKNPPNLEVSPDDTSKIGADVIMELRTALSILGFSVSQIYFSRISPGYSGLNVARIYFETGSEESSWLVKFGREKHKLYKEIICHRLAVCDGIDRDLYVVPYSVNIVDYGSIGVLAFEFERNAQTLGMAVAECSLEECIDRLVDLFRRFYRPTKYGLATLSSAYHFVEEDLVKAEKIVGFPLKFSSFWRSDRCHNLFHKGQNLSIGRIHGDLHLQNIMISEKRASLIDFAHFEPAAKRMPICRDLGKFIANLIYFGHTHTLALNDDLSVELSGEIESICSTIEGFRSENNNLISLAICIAIELVKLIGYNPTGVNNLRALEYLSMGCWEP